jgi:hypothetical protein
LPHFIEYIASVALHTSLNDPAVARRIGDVWALTATHSDLTFGHKHKVASMFAEYLVRTKNFLDAQNPLFKERAREAETVVKAITSTVNATAPAATAMKNRLIAAAKEKRKSQRPAKRA